MAIYCTPVMIEEFFFGRCKRDFRICIGLLWMWNQKARNFIRTSHFGSVLGLFIQAVYSSSIKSVRNVSLRDLTSSDHDSKV